MKTVILAQRISPKRTETPVRSLTASEILLSESAQPSQSTLKRIIVQGLLSFGEKTEFELGNLNLLVGPNGAGKSNLIDCIRLLSTAPFDLSSAYGDEGFSEWVYKGEGTQSPEISCIISLPRVSDDIVHSIRFTRIIQLLPQLEELIAPSSSDSHEPYFIGTAQSASLLTVSFSGKRKKTRIELDRSSYDRFHSILQQKRDSIHYPELTAVGNFYAEFKIYSEWEFGRKSNLRMATAAGGSVAHLSESMDNFPLFLNLLHGTSAHNRIRELLSEIKETYNDYLTRTLFGRIAVEILETPFDKPIPAQRLSDGTLRFLAISAILLQPDLPTLICLEEPELGMHPDMIRVVAKMIAEASHKTQLIVTTHSEHLLTALEEDFDTLFAFDAGINGSVVRRFDRQQFQEWKEMNSLGELWTSGELGGNRW